ncbi:sigma-54-dependent transcriptional regulator [Shewanella algae]|uniref:C4-dicarboxylate ABC transporter n=2 Tax=Shewanella algae TaxID=38313 RepID=A0AAD1NPQ8_9GAMM|nr:sigma-54 dependent transcriptional regulator [Shewanella algae]MBO2553207.1 sigma-54-dependent Fis family transcriptional regulator [Shewanella algae]MBO2578710.1 sigma-54-dependent Fis family transcriptional regulator [Shewanella algae]MBO2595942.1 sigma-54-dependent Fis family transcriptional regulator [Shewanella algae]MBO2604174.1 sigma-54-dependent Fis family transcriptional regulator [Shewanella algae]MBO2616861.1 sigma-54-dependent Fis family transcriptional regulator [Shewanella alg
MSEQEYTVLILDDEPHIGTVLSQLFELEGISAKASIQAKEILRHLSRDWMGVVITDVNMPGMDGISVMQQIKQLDADLPVILITGFGDIAMAVSAVKQGAYDFLEKPFNNEHILDVVKRALDKRSLTLENRKLKQELESQSLPGPRILGNSPGIRQMRHLIHQVLDTPADILIEGETGTGKELVARYLHDHSPRHGANFVAINCGAIPENIIESELFGAEAGAFTGADKTRIGKFEYANGGTLFLDEIESTPMALQVKLLRVLEDRRVERLGSNKSIALDIRVIAATKVDLKELCRQGSFREDLFYRLNLVTVAIPPLRERREDIPLLFLHFARIASARYHKALIALGGEQQARLSTHEWPGNVRELRNLAERYVLLGAEAAFAGAIGSSDSLQSGMSLTQRVEFFERLLIEEALAHNKGSIKLTMEQLELPRKTLYDKMRKYGLERKDYLNDAP